MQHVHRSKIVYDTYAQAGLVHVVSSIHSNSIPKEPKTLKAAFSHPGWQKAMEEEIEALHPNSTRVLVPHQLHMNVVGSR